MKFILRIALVTIIILVVIGLTSGGFAFSLNQAPEDRPEGNVIFTVNRGESVLMIAGRLEEERLIRSSLFLRLLARVKTTASSFQSGSYMIAGGASSLDVHDILVSGREILQKVTIPEGLTVSRIADVLESHGITSKADFVEASTDSELLSALGVNGRSAEGYLFPDTYLFPADYPADMVLALMVERFFDVLEEIDPDYGLMSGAELHEKVILASVIEREYVIENEAPLMASVFYNRLAIDMKLQSCATVVYAIAEEMGREHPEALTLRDLEVESLYNTYLYAGLPPNPIANPGRTALASVIFPAKTRDLFFVLKDPATGEHEFTENYREHLYAKNLYLKKR